MLRFILIWCILKLLSISKFIEHITGARTGNKQSETVKDSLPPKESATRDHSKLKDTKVRQRIKKSSDEPTFTTNLSTPIEDVIEETITDETQSELLVKKKRKSKGQVNKSKSEDLSKLNKSGNKKEKEEDHVGCVFPPEPLETIKIGKVSTKSKANLNVDHSENNDQEDDIGFSFFPVKEKVRRNKKIVTEKKNNRETLNTLLIEQGNRNTNENLTKPSIIDHYNKKVSKQTTSDTTLVASVKTPLENQKCEVKKSKLVSSAISYASVLTYSNVESKFNIELESSSAVNNNGECQPISIDKKEAVSSTLNSPFDLQTSQVTESQTVENSSQTTSDIYIESPHDSLTHLNSNITTGVESHLKVTENLIEENFDKISKSNSSSIEVISEFQEEINFERNCQNESYIEKFEAEDQIPFEIIEEDISKIVDSESDCDRFDQVAENLSNLESSSIYVVSNQIEYEDTLTTDKNENSAINSSSQDCFQDSELSNKLTQLEESSREEQLTENIQIKNTNEINYCKEKVLSFEDSSLDTPVEEKSSVENNIKTNRITSLVASENQVACVTILDKNISYRSKTVEKNFSSNTYINTYIDNQTNKNILQPLEGLSQETDKQEKFSQSIEEHRCVQEEKPISGTYLKATSAETLSSEKLNMATQQIRVLTLNHHEHQECTLYRLEKNWIIQFRLGPSLFGRKVYLYSNYPVESNGKLTEFNRSQYNLLDWVLDEGCKNADDTAAYTQIMVTLSGSFHYYFTYEKGKDAERQGSGFFLVDPILTYGNNENLPLDCIQCQTVLAKNLGSFSSWERKLQVAKESGYNMIHFSPIQELGISNSCYSLSEQLKLNPVFKKENGEMPTFKEVENFMAKIRKESKVTSICDIVLNHTANESQWIQKHPEVTYNCINCPYMRPAYILDAALHQFSMDVKKGFYEDKGIPPEINNEDHLNAIRYHFRTNVLEPLRLQELYICDVNKLVGEFLNHARTTTPVTPDLRSKCQELELIQDTEYKRLAATIDMTLAQKLFNVYWNDTFDEESRLKRCAEELKSKLDSLNNAITEKVNDHLSVAIENVIAGIRYFRVQADGPKFRDITLKHPLVYRYFTDYGSPNSLKEHEDIMYSSNGRFLMAHNGWVMNSDPLKNFAAPDSNVYIRRELIAWGDSVKLRYGDSPEDCPFLWEYMKEYVQETAKIFDGVRLDNCHSTPIPVAEYLLDWARKIKPDLYVVAELFTNSDLTDNIFVNRLGITSLIREAMSAWDSHEEGRLVYRYGGYPVGSFYQPSIRPLVPSVAHALFLDLTHDNPSPVEKRSVFDLLPSTALVNMACCASGSNRGYDELVPHHIHVVDETRQYTEWTDNEKLALGNVRYVTKKSGIICAKKAINDLHFTLGKEGFNQVYVDQMDPDIVAVTRHCPETHQSYILVAFTAFGHPNQDAESYQKGIKPLRVEGVLEEIVLEATLSHISNKSGGPKFAKWEKFMEDSKWINGLSEYQVSLKQHINIGESDIFEKVDSGTPNVIQLNFKNFKPGSIAVIKVSLPEVVRDSVKTVRTLIATINKNKELASVIDGLTLADLNRIIYRCGQEEKDEGFGFDTYNIPNFDYTVYAGLQGFISLLANIRPNNDLGHPMCANLRDGNWLIEYIWKRLKLDEGTKGLGQWIEENTKCFNNIPRYLVPCYFDAVVIGIYILLVEQCYKLMSIFVNHGSTFVRGLSLGSVQFLAYIKSSDLPVLSPNLTPPKPPTRKNDVGEVVQACVTLSAGLPHFSVGYMRNWGRDTFIALRGLLILTGRYEEARQHILGYAACLRHGLIPNLLDGGRNSRFNCRDAVWWWLYCIKEYVEEAPNGLNILNDKISRIFPTDDSPAQPPGAVDQPLCEVIQEALTVHFQGLAFRERNAGHQIDEHMTDRGFNNHIGIHPETGFVFGGNEWNCGTWMDKMGSSDKAGNRGKPATPRDGSAVELVGLSKAVVTWLARLSEEKKYPFSYVQRTHKNGMITKWSFREWGEKIQANFEKYFWVNTFPVPNEIKSNLINKRGIYKDCYGATQEWTDFQLRCNFPIAMVVAPELFTPQQAWIALKQAEKYLLGPLGMKTLDPEDWAYRGDYDNSNDSNDTSVAQGFNYHQGPEWVWPIGFFLRAKLHFAVANGALKETVASTKLILSKHFVELQTSPWRGLPELTNSNGSYCRDSSRTQAWSMSCILEVLNDLQKIESSQIILN